MHVKNRALQFADLRNAEFLGSDYVRDNPLLVFYEIRRRSLFSYSIPFVNSWATNLAEMERGAVLIESSVDDAFNTQEAFSYTNNPMESAWSSGNLR